MNREEADVLRQVEGMLKEGGVLHPFLSRQQRKVLTTLLRGEERRFFAQKLTEQALVIEKMPVTYGQSELGDQAIVHLHYFMGSMDAWVTEKDVEGGVDQAFGLVKIHEPELGYISIAELVGNGFEMDLHWVPKTIAEVESKL